MSNETHNDKINDSDIPGMVREIISKHLNIAKDEIQDSTHFVKDLGMDSLKSIEILMDLEEQLGFEIPYPAAERLHTFKQVTDYLHKKTHEEHPKHKRKTKNA